MRVWVRIVAVLVALVASQTYVYQRGGNEMDPQEKIQKGVYDPETVEFATTGYDTELRNGRLMEPDSPGLLYLAYLLEDYAKDLNFVSAGVVLPRLRDSYAAVDAAFGKELTFEQTELLNRIKTASSAASLRDQRHPAQCAEESSAKTGPGGELIINPTIVYCK